MSTKCCRRQSAFAASSVVLFVVVVFCFLFNSTPYKDYLFTPRNIKGKNSDLNGLGTPKEFPIFDHLKTQSVVTFNESDTPIGANEGLFSFYNISKHCGVNRLGLLGTEKLHDRCLKWLKNTKETRPYSTNIAENHTVIFHSAYWFNSPKLRKLSKAYLLSLYSVFATQPRSKFYLWIPEKSGEPELPPDLKCLVQIRRVTRSLLSVIERSLDQDPGTIFSEMQTSQTILSDIIRAVVVYEFGGVWIDLDTVLLRDITPLLEFDFMYHWSLFDYINTAVMHFSRRSKILTLFIKECAIESHTGAVSYHPHRYLECFRKKSVPFNESGSMILPSAFFDPHWIPSDVNKIPNAFPSFWEPCMKSCSLDQFFPGSFAYHMHYHGDKIADDSMLAILLEEFKAKVADCPNI